MKRLKFVAAILVIMVGILANISFAQINRGDLKGTECPVQYEGTIMKPDRETLRKWIEAYYSAPQAYIVPEIKLWIKQSPGIHFSLLDSLDYIPTERDQGSCGNCWVWAGTGILEIALNVQEYIKDRLSIQYFNSCYQEGSGTNWACCGGWLNWFADWYQAKGFAIPWSNINAHWQDGNQSCIHESSVPCSAISASPNYLITNCTATTIPTQGVEREEAIANIKNVLNQNKAVWLGYFLATGDDWDNFRSFWNNESEDKIWDPDFSCGHTWEENQGGGHAVLCVGYDDTDPGNSYWITLNSWGTTNERPNGLFRLDMNMNYDCCYIEDGEEYPSFFWQTLDVTFEILPPAGSLIAYPNPWYPNQPEKVTIANLPLNSKVYIYTISGELVRELDDPTEITTENGSATATWNLKNDAGEIVARGTYIYLVPEATDKKTGKIAIIK